MKKLLILTMLLLSSCMGVPKNINVIDGINAEQYLGTWYEIARLDHNFERGLDNVTAHYEKREDGGIKVTNRGYNRTDKEWNNAIGKAYFLEQPATDNTYLGKLKVSFFGPFYGAYNIIALDKEYYNYVMICGPDKEYLWILSRTPELTYPIKQHLVSQANQYGFATENLIYVNQNPDIPNYEAGQHVVNPKGIKKPKQ
jgi:apolipoprotein D and lipocalin family protein